MNPLHMSSELFEIFDISVTYLTNNKSATLSAHVIIGRSHGNCAVIGFRQYIWFIRSIGILHNHIRTAKRRHFVDLRRISGILVLDGNQLRVTRGCR